MMVKAKFKKRLPYAIKKAENCPFCRGRKTVYSIERVDGSTARRCTLCKRENVIEL